LCCTRIGSKAIFYAVECGAPLSYNFDGNPIKEVKPQMTKAVKELLMVFLFGAGALTLLWGFLYQKNISPTSGQVTLVSHIMWNAVGVGGGLIVVGAVLGFFLKPAK